MLRCILWMIMVGFTSCLWAQDDCWNATTLVPSIQVCGTTPTIIGPDVYTTSVSPANSCVNPDPPDAWVHLQVPLGSTSSYMIRRRAGTTIQARAEVFFTTDNTPANCEFAASQGCYNLEQFPNAIILQNPIPGNYYIRIWDAFGTPNFTLSVSAHELSGNINDWIICDDISGEGDGFRANQLILQPGEHFDVNNYPGQFVVVDSCPCPDPPLLLFEALDFDVFLDGRLTAQNDPDVEGTGYNYLLEDRRLPGIRTCDAMRPCNPLNQYVPATPLALSRVAIIDAGINSKHEAFEHALWENDDSSDPCLFIKSVGYDFKNHLETPEDSVGHGSWVAGTIVKDFPADIQLELMSMKFYNGQQDLLFDALCGMSFAVDEGASTMVTSWGFRSIEYPPLLEEVLLKARDHDVLVVASAGNLGNDNDDPDIGKYPANADHDNLLAVTAYDDVHDLVPSYANFGATTVDLAAVDHIITPGSVLSGNTLESRDSVFGTSISAPRVARTGAIIKAYYPNLTAQQIRTCIIQSAEEVSGLSGLVVSDGILDHEAALNCAAVQSQVNECVEKSLNVTGTLINDAEFHSQMTISSDAVIENTADILMGGQAVDLLSGFQVKEGALFQAINESCEEDPTKF